MKRVFGRIIASIGVLATLGACAPEKQAASSSGTIRVLAPMNSEGGAYKLAVTELSDVYDLDTMSGKYARFFLSPRVTNERLDGVNPKAKFIKNSDGVLVPADQLTGQMAVIYAHMQKLAALDKELGAEGVNKWPRDVGLAVRVKDAPGNNAFYEGTTDSILVVPYVSQDLAISINAGILAHEHFHSLFYKMVLEKKAANLHAEEMNKVLDLKLETTLSGRGIPSLESEGLTNEKLEELYYVAIARGLNEGLADFWGWMYTGDPDFIVQSLSNEKLRSMKASANEFSLFSQEKIKNDLRSLANFTSRNGIDIADMIPTYSYKLGTQFSRTMKVFSELHAKALGISSVEARKETAKIIIKMLPDIKNEMVQGSGKSFRARNFLEILAKNAVMTSEEECAFLADMLAGAEPFMSGVIASCREENKEWKLNVSVMQTPTDIPSVEFN